MIYCGPTGHNSKELVRYFQSLDGVPRIQEGINPATWMLEVTRPAEERRLGIDFAQEYAASGLFRQAPSSALLCLLSCLMLSLLQMMTL